MNVVQKPVGGNIVFELVAAFLEAGSVVNPKCNNESSCGKDFGMRCMCVLQKSTTNFKTLQLRLQNYQFVLRTTRRWRYNFINLWYFGRTTLFLIMFSTYVNFSDIFRSRSTGKKTTLNGLFDLEIWVPWSCLYSGNWNQNFNFEYCEHFSLC